MKAVEQQEGPEENLTKFLMGPIFIQRLEYVHNQLKVISPLEHYEQFQYDIGPKYDTGIHKSDDDMTRYQ